jgi:rSAM/selenodomain-associated transferase 1
MEKAIIIFIKNPVPGKVKTRLAATVGNEKALDIYLQLIAHTLGEAEEVDADKFIFFSDVIDEAIGSNEKPFHKTVQQGKDLGEKMLNAFANVFIKGYKKTIIIGTDCPGINSAILNEAFEKLAVAEIVIGPAADGGYYLLGMTKLHTELFYNIEWGTNSVLWSTIEKCAKNKVSHSLLKALSDVDEEKDLVHFEKLMKQKRV